MRIAVLAVLACLFALPAAAQTGTLEFTTRVSPTVGAAEPARKMEFCLLRKSFEEIRKEAEEVEPKADLEKFVEGLEVSTELKTWMKSNKLVQFTGEEFPKRVTPNDILDVPEFFDAYISQNAGDPSFPEPKYKERDRERNPQRYERQRKEYREQLRKFARQNPHTFTGIEMQLMPLDPGTRWTRLETDRRQRVRLRGMALAQTKYLVARLETDLQGRAGLINVPPGEYWLSSLDTDAAVGDVRIRWDTPVKIAAGRATRLELSNLNAVQPK